jgi:hypothetical protein
MAKIATAGKPLVLALRTSPKRLTRSIEGSDCLEQFKATILVGPNVSGTWSVWGVSPSGYLTEIFSCRNLKFNELRHVNVWVPRERVEVNFLEPAWVARLAQISFHCEAYSQRRITTIGRICAARNAALWWIELAQVRDELLCQQLLVPMTLPSWLKPTMAQG